MTEIPGQAHHCAGQPRPGSSAPGEPHHYVQQPQYPAGRPSHTTAHPQSDHPGWAARILFIAQFPVVAAFFYAAALLQRRFTTTFEPFWYTTATVATYGGVAVGLLLGILALLLVRNSAWAHRGIAVGLLVFGAVVGELLAVFSMEVYLQLSWGFVGAMVLVSFAVGFPLGMALLAWSIARRRGWILHVVSFALGVGIPVLAGFVASLGAGPFYQGVAARGLGLEYQLIVLAVTLLTVLVTMALGHFASPRRR